MQSLNVHYLADKRLFLPQQSPPELCVARGRQVSDVHQHDTWCQINKSVSLLCWAAAESMFTQVVSLEIIAHGLYTLDYD